MNENEMDRVVDTARELYNAPGEVPREDMWRVIEAGLDGAPVEVVDLAAERRRRSFGGSRAIGWAVAAAAVLVIGIGIGRMTAPGTVTPVANATGASEALAYAAAEHFGRTESLLTMVRADARRGQLDPAIGEWADGLLSETRLLIDANQAGDSEVEALLEDLELILAQIVGAAHRPGEVDGTRTQTELQLALRGLEDRELMARLQAAGRSGLSGT